MNIITVTKSAAVSAAMICALSGSALAQQWFGEDNTTAPILRSGQVGIGSGNAFDPRNDDTLLQLRRLITDRGGLLSVTTEWRGDPYNILDVNTSRVAIGNAANKDALIPSNVFDLTVGRGVAIGLINVDEELSADYKLVVAGKVLAEELRVMLVDQWSDYVFEPDYQLRSLPEVADYIETHKHLPDIPSAAEVERDGISIGDMQAKLLAKIEELTLHMIEQHRTIETLQRKLDALEKGEG